MAGYLFFLTNDMSCKLNKLAEEVNTYHDDPVNDEDIVHYVLEGFFKSRVDRVQYINKAIDEELEKEKQRYLEMAKNSTHELARQQAEEMAEAIN